jgi:antitoxin (DNA-binding transcriptional repressor) of toxin-antitoxin stability system
MQDYGYRNCSDSLRYYWAHVSLGVELQITDHGIPIASVNNVKYTNLPIRHRHDRINRPSSGSKSRTSAVRSHPGMT